MRKYGVLCILTLLPALAAAQDLPDPLLMASSAHGRIQVFAPRAESTQKLSIWAARGLEHLEEAWGRSLPFQQGHPFRIVVQPERKDIVLAQDWSNGVLSQTLYLAGDSAEKNPRGVAEAFTRAMGTRLGLQDLPAEEKNVKWTMPDWLVAGTAHVLLAGRSEELFTWLVRRGPDEEHPYPEQIVLMRISTDFPRREAAAAQMCRWWFDQTPDGFWKDLARGGFRRPEDLVNAFPTAGNLRELHQVWDLWWLEEEKKVIAEFSLQAEAELLFMQELTILPAFYGWRVDTMDRYQAVTFPELTAYLDDPRFSRGMRQWLLRLQRIRFRQPPALNRKISDVERAGYLAIKASAEEGRKRTRLWERAVDIHNGAFAY